MTLLQASPLQYSAPQSQASIGRSQPTSSDADDDDYNQDDKDDENNNDDYSDIGYDDDHPK